MNRLITYIRQFFGTIKKVSDWSLVRQNSAYHPQDVECRPVEFAVVLDNGNQAVCDNRNIDLYSHRILGIAPEGRYPEMLLYPSEEQFHLPSLLVQQGYITGLEHKILGLAKRQSRAVCQECKCPLQFRSIIDYPPESTRILLLGLIARKAANHEMVTFILDGVNDADDFSEAVAAGKLSEHHHKKLVPACECLHILVSAVLLDDTIKYSLRQKLYELAEKIFSAIHAVQDYIQTAKMHNQFKSTRAVFAYN